METVAVPTALVAYNWPPNHDRYRRIAKFVDAFFGKFDQFHKAPRHVRWKAVNLAAELKGWTRLKAAQDWLDKVPAQRLPPSASPGIDTVLARTQAARAAPGRPDEQERLFQQFLEWSKRRKSRTMARGGVPHSIEQDLRPGGRQEGRTNGKEGQSIYVSGDCHRVQQTCRGGLPLPLWWL